MLESLVPSAAPTIPGHASRAFVARALFSLFWSLRPGPSLAGTPAGLDSSTASTGSRASAALRGVGL